MENASKALLMAGGVLLTMLVVTLLVYAWNVFSDYQENIAKIKETEEVAKFNQQFTNYERDDVQGYELLSLINKVIDYNQRHSEAGTSYSTSDWDKVGNSESYKPINVSIKLSDTTDFKRGIKKPNYQLDMNKLVDRGTDYTSIQGDLIFQSKKDLSVTNAKKQLNLENILENYIRKAENNISVFGSKTGIQNLVKNIPTIYEGFIIGYNGKPTPGDESAWYDASYIISRYKTLTGVEPVGTTEDNKIDWIRKDENIEMVSEYYQYTQFKKETFECTLLEYYPDTGRVSKMAFQQK